MATLPRVAAPVNGRPARSRTAARKGASPADIVSVGDAPTPPPPRLMVTLYHGNGGASHTVADYPPGTPTNFRFITTEQHRLTICRAMRTGAVGFDSGHADTLNFCILFPVPRGGGWTWQTTDDGGRLFETGALSELFDLTLAHDAG